MRSMWKGSISFGLVTIPVKLYTATEAKDLRFNMLHEECRTPIQYRKWCPTCDREVSSAEIVKGYEVEPGRYVLMAEEDFESIPLAAAHTLEIVGFVNLEQIDPVYFEKTYYLEPGEGGAKAYALLRRAMEETGRVAVARVVLRAKESLCAIRVFAGGVLAMETMHFPDEVRSPAGLANITQPELRPQEVSMAVDLISSLSGDFEPEKFQNEYRQALLERIEAKVQGDEAAPVTAAPKQGRVVDLMEALRASIRQAEAGRGPGAAAAAGPAAPGVAPAPGPAMAPVPGLAPASGPEVAPVPGLAPAPLVPGVAAPLPPAPGVAVPPLPVPGVPGAAAQPVPGATPVPGAPSLSQAAPPAPGSPAPARSPVGPPV